MHKKTIKELQEALVTGEISANELYQSVVEDIKKVNPNLHAINNISEFKQSNTKSNSLLNNIPYVMKDLVATQNELTTSSSTILEDFRPPYNATIYNHLNNANAIMVGKSNLDQFGIGGTNENSIYGYARNPYDLDFTAGGSSGGSASIVAAGCVPFAIGSDTGDSTRKPAGYCGIYGYKPTWSLISRYGIFAYAPSFDQVGLFARCIDDIAIVMQELNGPDIMDTTSSIHEKEFYYDNLHANSKKLKIGYIRGILDSFNNDVVLKQFEETKEYIKSLGHEIVEIDYNIDLLRAIRGTYQIIVNAENSSTLANLTGIHFGKQIISEDVKSSIIETRSQGLEKFTKARNIVGAMALKEIDKDRYFIKAKQVRRLMIEEANRVFNDVDLVIAPTSNTNSFNPTNSTTSHDDTALIAENHLTLANLVGACGLSIPTHFHNDLPYGISIMAKPFNDQLLLNFGKEFENGLLKNDFLSLKSFYNVYKEVK